MKDFIVVQMSARSYVVAQRDGDDSMDDTKYTICTKKLKNPWAAEQVRRELSTLDDREYSLLTRQSILED